MIAEILKGNPTPPAELAPEVPADIARIVGKALRKDRETRYQSVADLLLDLHDYKQEAEFQAKLKVPSRPQLKKSRSGRAKAAPRRGFGSGCRRSRNWWLWPAR